MTTELTDDQIRDVFLANGFTIKDGQPDLKPYVYAAARALLALQASRGEVMANGLTEAETSASSSVVGLMLEVPPDGWSIERFGNGDVVTSASTDGVRWPAVNAASADDMKVYDGIAAGYHRSTASAIDPSKMRGPCGMATSQHAGRRRITLEFDMPEDALEAHAALMEMGWSHRTIRGPEGGAL